MGFSKVFGKVSIKTSDEFIGKKLHAKGPLSAKNVAFFILFDFSTLAAVKKNVKQTN